MFEDVKNHRDVLKRLILAELIAKPGRGPLALRGPFARAAWFARGADLLRAASDASAPSAPLGEVDKP